MFCNLVKAELGDVLSQNLEPGGALFALCEATIRLEQAVRQWAPAALGRFLCSLHSKLQICKGNLPDQRMPIGKDTYLPGA